MDAPCCFFPRTTVTLPPHIAARVSLLSLPKACQRCWIHLVTDLASCKMFTAQRSVYATRVWCALAVVGVWHVSPLRKEGPFYAHTRSPHAMIAGPIFRHALRTCLWSRVDIAVHHKRSEHHTGLVFAPDVDTSRGAIECTFEDFPSRHRWRALRVGPFVGGGNTDWHEVMVTDNITRNRPVWVTGVYYAPVDGRGRAIPSPPLQIHHSIMFTNNTVNNAFSYGSEQQCALAFGGMDCKYSRYLWVLE